VFVLRCHSKIFKCFRDAEVAFEVEHASPIIWQRPRDHFEVLLIIGKTNLTIRIPNIPTPILKLVERLRLCELISGLLSVNSLNLSFYLNNYVPPNLNRLLLHGYYRVMPQALIR
jgi:hypothetical protein